MSVTHGGQLLLVWKTHLVLLHYINTNFKIQLQEDCIVCTFNADSPIDRFGAGGPKSVAGMPISCLSCLGCLAIVT